MSKPKDYPLLWQRGVIQRHVRILAGHRCEWCGMLFHLNSNKAVFATNRKGRQIIGTVHHINRNKEDMRWQNLVFLCQICHCRAEWQWEPGAPIPFKWLVLSNGVPNWITARQLPYQLNYCFPAPIPQVLQPILL